jgi:hypothetical protein
LVSSACALASAAAIAPIESLDRCMAALRAQHVKADGEPWGQGACARHEFWNGRGELLQVWFAGAPERGLAVDQQSEALFEAECRDVGLLLLLLEGLRPPCRSIRA